MTTGSEGPDLQGVQFVARGGRRSSQSAGKAILADAVRAVDPELAASIESAKDWRKSYIGPFRDVVVAGASSAKDSLRIAADGLDAVHRNVAFVRGTTETPLRDALRAGATGGFETAEVQGEGQESPRLEVPYRGELLSDDALLRQFEKWEQEGILEPSCRVALSQVVRNPAWLDLSDRHFVLLGAASEMGPLSSLCSWRANVIAVDLPRPALWERIVDVASKGSGRLLAPVTGSEGDLPNRAGADLLTQTPEVRAWLGGFEKPFTIGNYVYADGATFVRLAAAADTLVGDLLSTRSDISLAYLATPTDVFAVPGELATAVRSRTRGRSVARMLTGSRLYSPNYATLVAGENGREWGISDSLVPIQGSNYALAKSLQRWRAVLAREEGALSSANVAPSTRTRSVVKNRMLAAAYRGAPSFGVEIFESHTSRVLTAALLVHDLRNPQAPANPQTALDHPYDLFADAALHGGLWRLPYEARSVLPLALVLGLVKRS